MSVSVSLGYVVLCLRCLLLGAASSTSCALVSGDPMLLAVLLMTAVFPGAYWATSLQNDRKNAFVHILRTLDECVG